MEARVDKATALAEYRRHVNNLARALLRGEDPNFACAAERAQVMISYDPTDEPWGLHANSQVIAKHNPIVAASVNLVRADALLEWRYA